MLLRNAVMTEDRGSSGRQEGVSSMGLVYKELKDIGRRMYLYFPNQEKRTAFKRSLITVFRDGDDEASVQELLEKQGMRKQIGRAHV